MIQSARFHHASEVTRQESAAADYLLLCELTHRAQTAGLGLADKPEEVGEAGMSCVCKFVSASIRVPMVYRKII